MGAIVAFYSFKGGVGRTMAVANIGCLLAKTRKRILLVDWDLEAPGLHRYFESFVQKPSAKPGGLMALLHEMSGSSAGEVDSRPYCRSIELPDGELWLLDSGFGTKDYEKEVLQFSWHQFFSSNDGGPKLDQLRQQWLRQYDLVLIDSRTGITDAGGICTVFMPDLLVLVFTANSQSLDGAIDVAHRAQNGRQRIPYDRRRLPILPVPSRFDSRTEHAEAEQWLKVFENRLEPFYRDWLPQGVSIRAILERTKVPHVPFFSFGEKLPVVTHTLTDPDLPGFYYQNLATLVAGQCDVRSVRLVADFPTLSRPNNLPFASLGALFVGRGTCLIYLHQALLERSSFTSLATGTTIAICGMGGVGKTRLAVEYASRFGEDYSAILFASAHSPQGLREHLGALSGPNALCLSEGEGTEQPLQVAASIRWLQENPGWLLILDHVDSTDAMAAVEELLAKVASCGHVLVTSRLNTWRGAVSCLSLALLSQEDAARYLLERTAGRRLNDTDDKESALLLGAMLGQLPLMLEQASAYICTRGLSFSDYVSEWNSKHAKTLVWWDESIKDYPCSVAATWQTTVDTLSDPARELLRVLSWFASDPIPTSILGASAGFSAEDGRSDLRDALGELAMFHLVHRDSEHPQFSLHPIVQDVSRHWLDLAHDDGPLEKAVGWLDEVFVGDPSDVRSWPILEPLSPHVRACVSRAVRARISGPTIWLLNQLGLFYAAKAEFSEAKPLLDLALGLYQQGYGLDHPGIGTSLSNLATLLADTNRLSEAEPLMRQALAIDEASYGPDHPKVATDLNNLASLLQDTNRLSEAEPLMRRALRIVEASYGPGHPEVARDLNNLASLLYATNRLSEAEPLMRRALAIFETSLGADHPNVATQLSNLAQLLQATNRLSEAEPLMRRALAIDEASYGPEHPDVARDLNNLASLLQATNRLDQAEPLMRRVVEIFVLFTRATGHPHPHLEAAVNNYGQLLMEMGRTQDQAMAAVHAIDPELDDSVGSQEASIEDDSERSYSD